MPARKEPTRKRPPLAAQFREELKRFRELFRSWGRKGGKARAKALSPEQRRKIARKAAEARWGHKGQKSGSR